MATFAHADHGGTIVYLESQNLGLFLHKAALLFNYLISFFHNSSPPPLLFCSQSTTLLVCMTLGHSRTQVPTVGEKGPYIPLPQL